MLSSFSKIIFTNLKSTIFSNFKIWRQTSSFMIQREELEQILNFVASRWNEVAKDPNSKPLEAFAK